MSANGAGEKMRVDLADSLDIRRNLRPREARSHKSATPLFGSQKAGVWTNFRICFHIGKTVENLKHYFGIHRLVIVRSHTFPDGEPTARSEPRSRFVQAKQEILRDVHDVNSVHEIEFSRGNPLRPPRQIEIDCSPCQREIRVLRC